MDMTNFGYDPEDREFEFGKLPFWWTWILRILDWVV